MLGDDAGFEKNRRRYQQLSGRKAGAPGSRSGAPTEGSHRGFTLIELMIVVAIVGILAMLAVMSVRKYIANAKTAEARNAIGQIAKDASAAFERERMSGAVLPLGSVSTSSRALCYGHPVSVPNNFALIQGRKYQSRPTEWNGAFNDVTGQPIGFTCLRFSIDAPQYYAYAYNTVGSRTAPGGGFAAIAQGDLNGNGTLSNFSFSGRIQMDPAGGGIVVTLAPNIIEISPDE